MPARAIVYDFTYLVNIGPDQVMTYATHQPYLMTQTVDFRRTPDGWRVGAITVDSVVMPMNSAPPASRI